MTDSPSPADPGPVDPDVELASAHLDGEAGPDERARAEEPAIAGHVAAFRGVADEVRDVPPPPAGLLDDQVARAMASFDDGGRVVPIGRARSTHATPWWQRIPLGAVAAALIVVALVGVASVGGFGGGDDDDTASSAFDSADDSGGDADASGGAQETMADAMEESATMQTEAALGGGSGRQTFVGYDDLAASLRDELAATPAAPTADDGDATQDPTTSRAAPPDGEDGEDAATDPCEAVAVLDVDPADVVLVRPAAVGADDVTAVVHDAADGRRMGVVDDATCTVVLDRLL